MAMAADRLQELSDRAAIRALIWEYAAALDRRDFDLLASTFTGDATAIYSGNSVGPGIDEILKYLDGLKSTKRSSHFMLNQTVKLEGDAARSETYAIACVVTTSEGRDSMRTRGLLYRDDLVKQNGRWLVKHRHHMALWERHGGVKVPAESRA